MILKKPGHVINNFDSRFIIHINTFQYMTLTDAMFNYGTVLSMLSLSSLLVSFFIPWLTINFLGNWFYSPIDIVNIIIGQESKTKNGPKPNVIDLISPNQDRSFDLVFSNIAYLISLPLMLVSVVAFWKKHQSRITIVSGILAVVGGITWIHSIQVIKSSASAAVGSDLINAVIVLGFAPYLVSIGGILAIAAYFLAKKYPE